MKTIKIITSALVMTAVFTSNIQPIFANSISPTMQTAIANAKKVEAEQRLQNKYASKKAKYNKQVAGVKAQISELSVKYSSKDQKYLAEGIARYEMIIKRISTAIAKAEKIKKDVYRIVYVPVLQDLKQIFVENLAVLNTVKTTKYSPSGGNSSTGVVVAPPKNNTTTPLDVVNAVKDTVKNTKVEKLDPYENVKFREDLEKKGVTPLEASLLAWENFRFCANFTPELYNEHGFWYYESSTQEDHREAVYASDAFINSQLPKLYDDLETLGQLSKINGCVYGMKAREDGYGIQVTQALVKDVYDKYYGGSFKVWTQPFYKLDEAGRYDFLKNLQKKIGAHQGITNYGLDYIY